MPEHILVDLAGPILRVLVFIFRHIIWELLLELLFWDTGCGMIGWFVLRIVTLGQRPTYSLRAIWNDRAESFDAHIVGFVTILIAGIALWIAL